MAMAAVKEEHFVVRPSMLQSFPLLYFSLDAISWMLHTPQYYKMLKMLLHFGE